MLVLLLIDYFMLEVDLYFVFGFFLQVRVFGCVGEQDRAGQGREGVASAAT